MRPIISSATRLIPYGQELSAPVSSAALENIADDVECELAMISEDDNYGVYEPSIHKKFFRVN